MLLLLLSLAQRPMPSMETMAGHSMSHDMDSITMRHMEMTPARTATHTDTARALAVAAELRRAISKYQDTAAAVAAGYEMFLPNLKTQKIFHFTSRKRALFEAFRFNADEPTSLLYKRGADGK